tara:strand:+ start:1194 stop:1574 length:381 start_codon:yes stop_codon:yes gene_type:complete
MEKGESLLLVVQRHSQLPFRERPTITRDRAQDRIELFMNSCSARETEFFNSIGQEQVLKAEHRLGQFIGLGVGGDQQAHDQGTQVAFYTAQFEQLGTAPGLGPQQPWGCCSPDRSLSNALKLAKER